MTGLRCRPGDLALVIYDEESCATNIGRLVRVRGPLEADSQSCLPSWLIRPLDRRLWRVAFPSGWVQSMRVGWIDRVEHPDAWLLPIKPGHRLYEHAQSIVRCESAPMYPPELERIG